MKINLKIPLCLILFSMLGCETQTNIDIQGHRGCRGLLPENTLPAFEKAIELGVNTLELDVVISKDQKVVVSHEPFLNHLICNVDGIEITEENEESFNLYEMTYDSISKFDCGSKVHPNFPDQKKIQLHKPLLSEVIEMAEKNSNGTIHYNIEIKSRESWDGIYSPDISTFVSLVISDLEKFPIEDRFNLQSFDLRALEEIHNKNPRIPIALLVEGSESIDKKLSRLTFKPEIISPYFGLINEASVNKYQGQGYQIIPWTVNEKDDMEKMMALKVDGIITDYPDILMDLVSE